MASPARPSDPTHPPAKMAASSRPSNLGIRNNAIWSIPVRLRRHGCAEHPTGPSGRPAPSCVAVAGRGAPTIHMASRRGGLALKAHGYLLEQVCGPLQLAGSPPAAVFGLGQQPGAAVDGGGEAGGKGGLVAPQARSQLAAGRLAELLGGRSSQPPSSILTSSAACSRARTMARARAAWAPSSRQLAQASCSASTVTRGTLKPTRAIPRSRSGATKSGRGTPKLLAARPPRPPAAGPGRLRGGARPARRWPAPPGAARSPRPGLAGRAARPPREGGVIGRVAGQPVRHGGELSPSGDQILGWEA